MDSKTLREKYLRFFKKNGHKIIPSAPLVPAEDEQLEGKEKVLFTSAGMQPLIPYLTGQKEPISKRLVDVQKCLRTDDIEKVGDLVHHTFFEMMGNWSIGDYWKKEAITLSFEFLTEELEIPVNKLAVTVFAGDNDTPRDEESAKTWESLGIPKEKIYYSGKEHNWWPSGEKSGPCGPDTEMFYWTGEGESEGKPNEDVRWVEIWNDVFMQFNRKEDGALEDLPQKNVDTGMGLERTLAVLNGLDDDYRTDLFIPVIEIIERYTNKEYSDAENQEAMRVIADHMKAAVHLIIDGVQPSNKLQGYILRRLIRRSAVKMHKLNGGLTALPAFSAIVESIGSNKRDLAEEVVKNELNKFRDSLDRGLKQVEKIDRIDGKKAFDLYQTFGFPYEVTEELFRQKGQEIDREQFKAEFEKHRELSRTASSGMFKGGLADSSEIVTKYHTATHLLHQALRDILGPQVFQKGSNITAERLRFDFSFDKKMTNEEIIKTEDLINRKIQEDLKVEQKTVSLDEAKKMNAIGLFNEKYGTNVSVYKIGDYSLEICGGPHVEHTGVIEKIKITKEEAVSQGVRRIRAILC